MNNTIVAIAIAVAGFSVFPATSHAVEDRGGFFVNGNVGRSMLDSGIYDDNDTGYGVNLGYRWAVAPDFALGVEGGYVDLGKWSSPLLNDNDSPSIHVFQDAKVKGWIAGVNAHWNLSDNWYVSGRTGLFRADVQGWYFIEGSTDTGGLPTFGSRIGIKDTTTKWYAGAGFGHDFNSRFSVGLNYDYYKADKSGLKVDPGLVSASAEMRF